MEEKSTTVDPNSLNPNPQQAAQTIPVQPMQQQNVAAAVLPNTPITSSPAQTNPPHPSFFQKLTSNPSLYSLILRLGLAFVFIYAAVFMTLTPEKYMVYFPPFMRTLLPGYTILHIYSVFEVILSLWLISGKKIVWSSLLAAATLIGIVVFNMDKMSVVFRNIGIMTGALALAVNPGTSKKSS